MRNIPFWVPWLVLLLLGTAAALIIVIGLRWGIAAAASTFVAVSAAEIAARLSSRYYRSQP